MKYEESRNIKQGYDIIIEPQYVISKNVAFWQV